MTCSPWSPPARTSLSSRRCCQEKKNLAWLVITIISTFLHVCQVMRHAGVAITITTFTDLIAFAIGSFSKVYFVK